MLPSAADDDDARRGRGGSATSGAPVFFFFAAAVGGPASSEAAAGLVCDQAARGGVEDVELRKKNEYTEFLTNKTHALFPPPFFSFSLSVFPYMLLSRLIKRYIVPLSFFPLKREIIVELAS